MRRLVVLRERHAFFPKEVTERQVEVLAERLEAIRVEIDALRSDLTSSRDSG